MKCKIGRTKVQKNFQSMKRRSYTYCYQCSQRTAKLGMKAAETKLVTKCLASQTERSKHQTRENSGRHKLGAKTVYTKIGTLSLMHARKVKINRCSSARFHQTIIVTLLSYRSTLENKVHKGVIIKNMPLTE